MFKNWVAIIISGVALGTSFHSCSQVEQAQKAQIRPYIIIEPSMNSNQLEWDGSVSLKFPYGLKNIGEAPALKILQGYDSYLENKSGGSNLVQSFKDQPGREDALAPTQTSAIHMRDINMTGFDPNQHVSIRVELKITYGGFPEIDSRSYSSKAIFKLTPREGPENKFIFLVSQPKLAFGFEK